MKLTAIMATLCALVANVGFALADNFVYPVGVSNQRPAKVPNANGYVITQNFANTAGHTAVDLANGTEGDEVRAITSGKVSFVASTANSSGFGNVVMIHHDLPKGTYYSLYAHLQEGSVAVRPGEPVNAGQQIGKVDCTGKSEGSGRCPSNGGTGSHLHFAVKRTPILGCAYISVGTCTKSKETFNDYVDPLEFVASGIVVQPIVLQPGPGEGKDIWTTSRYCYCPGGGGPGGGLDDQWLRVGGWGDLYYSLIQFELSSLPTEAASARLELFLPQIVGDGTTEVYVDRITSSWDWRSQGTGSDHLRLWWADRPATTQWSSSALPAPTAGNWYSIDLTTLYNGWQKGTYPNYGVQLRPTSNANRWAQFYSSDYMGDASLRPKLVVTPK